MSSAFHTDLWGFEDELLVQDLLETIYASSLRLIFKTNPLRLRSWPIQHTNAVGQVTGRWLLWWLINSYLH